MRCRSARGGMPWMPLAFKTVSPFVVPMSKGCGEMNPRLAQLPNAEFTFTPWALGAAVLPPGPTYEKMSQSDSWLLSRLSSATLPPNLSTVGNFSRIGTA